MLLKVETGVILGIVFLLYGFIEWGAMYISLFVLLLLVDLDVGGEFISEAIETLSDIPRLLWEKNMTSPSNKAKKVEGIGINSSYLVKGPDHL